MKSYGECVRASCCLCAGVLSNNVPARVAGVGTRRDLKKCTYVITLCLDCRFYYLVDYRGDDPDVELFRLFIESKVAGTASDDYKVCAWSRLWTPATWLT